MQTDFCGVGRKNAEKLRLCQVAPPWVDAASLWSQMRMNKFKGTTLEEVCALTVLSSVQ